MNLRNIIPLGLGRISVGLRVFFYLSWYNKTRLNKFPPHIARRLYADTTKWWWLGQTIKSGLAEGNESPLYLVQALQSLSAPHRPRSSRRKTSRLSEITWLLRYLGQGHNPLSTAEIPDSGGRFRGRDKAALLNLMRFALSELRELTLTQKASVLPVCI